MITRLLAVCGVILMAATSSVADSGRARDCDGQMTMPSLAAQEKARTVRLDKLTVAKLEAAIRQILEQEERKNHPVIETPARPPKKS
jgi:hypothetical protein